MTKMLFLPDSRDRALPKDRNTRETISCNMKFCFLCLLIMILKTCTNHLVPELLAFMP